MLLHEKLTEKIIEVFYKVYNELGYGFLEKVYENALKIELERIGMSISSQVPINVLYSGVNVGFYVADLIVEDVIILEIKAGDGIIVEQHEAQLINYLRATDKEIGLLFHFGKKPLFKRKIYSNNLK
ncbi:MAG: GxxExxY protein [Rhizobacter sp.]|nr:GxxExxY protein [Ferruginibacter sp.]